MNEAHAIESFAIACERLNDYARELRNAAAFREVTTGNGIRNYTNGWRLEKWLEAELNRDEGWSAAWWLELGGTDGDWLIVSHLSISHSDVFIELREQTVPSAELHQHLMSAVQELESSLKDNATFAREVALRKK